MQRVDTASKWLAPVYALPLPWRLTIAILIVLAAALARHLMTPWLNDRSPYATFYLAVEITAVLGGLFPGLLATLASAITAHIFFAPVASPANGPALAFFLTGSVILSVIAELLQRTWLRFDELRTRSVIAEKLYVANQHFQVAVSAGAIGAWNLDVARNIATVSDELRAIFGFGPDVVVNTDAVRRIVLPDDATLINEALQKAFDPSGNGLYRAEYRIRRPTDGSIRWIASRGQVLFENGEARRIVGVTRDVTEEKIAARALLERAQIAEQLASVAATAPGVIFSFYLDSGGHVAYRYISPKAKEVFGVPAQDICADAAIFYKRVHTDDHASLNAALRESAHSLSHWDVDFRFDHPEKGAIWLEAQAAPVREPDGELVWHGYLSDVTDRKQSEISLAETAARLQATIDGARDAIITMDEEGHIQSVNAAGLSMFGYSASEVTGRDIEALVTDPAHAFEVNATGSMIALDKTWDVEGRRGNGQVFPAELSLSEAKYQRRRLLIVFVKDLSEQRRIQQRVARLHRDRMDAMGGMAATLAHEVNQPLAATASYLKVARRLLEKAGRDEDVNILQVIDKAAAQTLRAGRIVNSLRQLVTRGEPDKTLVSLHDLIRGARDSMLNEGAQSNIEVRLEFNAKDDEVIADGTQIRQVVVNLMRNSVEAMQETGERELIVSTFNPDDATISVEVADRGGGLDENAEADFFEPFATTKAKGMGVGLSISRSIVEAHYGRIWARPNPGGGAVFSFTLPLENTGPEI